MQQQQSETAAQIEREKEDREDARKQLDSDTKIRVAEIAAEARMADADHNNDGYVDNTDRSEVARLDAVDRDRTAREKNQADLQLKREELAEKKRTNKANENIKKTAAKDKKKEKKS